MDAKKWYHCSYRRNLVDMHIPDWDERFLADFDSQSYADLLELAKVDMAMIYTSSCLGISNWPTPVGHMHSGLNGRDIVGELIEKCREKGMNVLLYLNFWSTWAYNEHPEWRFINSRGEGTAEYLWDTAPKLDTYMLLLLRYE